MILFLLIKSVNDTIYVVSTLYAITYVFYNILNYYQNLSIGKACDCYNKVWLLLVLLSFMYLLLSWIRQSRDLYLFKTAYKYHYNY